jgi:hypothetical protein
MSGTTPLIDQIDFASSQKEVVVNRVNNAEAPAAVFGIKTLVGLSLVLYGGAVDNAGTPTIVANQTITLTDNATNYVKRTAAGVVSAVTSAPSGWPATLAGVIALYTIVTASGLATSVTEWRVAAGNVAGAAAAPVKVIQVACSDETTALTTGTSKVKFRMPYAMTLTAVRASLSTTSSSGIPAIDINESGASIFSTTLTIDTGEKTSTTAATPAVISDANLADDAEITVDIDTAGTGATGLKITLIGT